MRRGDWWMRVSSDGVFVGTNEGRFSERQLWRLGTACIIQADRLRQDRESLAAARRDRRRELATRGSHKRI